MLLSEVAIGDIKKLIRFKSDAWVTARLDALTEELEQGFTFTSFSEAGKSHQQERTLPISDMIRAVTDEAYRRGLNESGNTAPSRYTKATFGP